MASFTFKEDTPHGLAKRIVLYRIIQAEFPKAIYNRFYSSNGADFTYFDAFAGEGWYDTGAEVEKEDETGESSNSPVHSNFTCPFGDRRMGSPLVALEAIYQHFSEIKKETMEKSFKNSRITSRIIFEEKDKKRFQKLIENVLWFIENKKEGFQLVEESDKDYLWEYVRHTNDGMTFSLALEKKEDYVYEWIMKKDDKTHSIVIVFENNSFKDLDIDNFKDNYPMISFFDPIGFSGIPMEKVQELSGSKRKILLNFMVQAINRFMDVETQCDNMSELFGDKGWKKNLSEGFKSQNVPNKMKQLVHVYTNCFRKASVYNHNQVQILTMSVRKRKETGFIYYLVYVATALSDLQTAKYALTKVSEKPALMLQYKDIKDKELYFSDSKAVDHLRDQTEEEKYMKFEREAETIFNHWRGGKCTFGVVKMWILLNTPYEIHSTAFRILEKKNLLKVNSSRKRKAFPPYVGVTESDPDKNTKKPYCNAWELEFLDGNFDGSSPMVSDGVFEDVKNNQERVASGNKRRLENEKENETPYKEENSNSPNAENPKRKLFNQN